MLYAGDTVTKCCASWPVAFLATGQGSLGRLTHRVASRVPLRPVGLAPSPQCLPGALTGSATPTHTGRSLPSTPGSCVYPLSPAVHCGCEAILRAIFVHIADPI